jgi:hypothetical protein
MALQVADILKILKENYRQAVELLPPDLAAEFQRKVIREEDLKAYASSILVTIQLGNQTGMLRIQNWVADDFQRGGFAKKVVAKGLNPAQIYELLLKGIYDY